MRNEMSIELTRLRTSSFLTEEPLARSPTTHVDNGIFPRSLSLGDDPVFESIKPGWKHTLFALLERPTSSPAAFLLYAVTTGLIIFSALVTVLETVPAFHSISNRIWFGIETSLVALFTIEYIARCIAWSTTWMALFKFMFCPFLYFHLRTPTYGFVQLSLGSLIYLLSSPITSSSFFDKTP